MGNHEQFGRGREGQNGKLSKKVRRSDPVHLVEQFNPPSTNGEAWNGPVTPHDAACYINDITRELQALAESARLSFLAYLLGLVIEESAVRKRGRL